MYVCECDLFNNISDVADHDEPGEVVTERNRGGRTTGTRRPLAQPGYTGILIQSRNYESIAGNTLRYNAML